MSVPLPELIGHRRALVSQLNALNDQITAVDGLIGRAHLQQANGAVPAPLPFAVIARPAKPARPAVCVRRTKRGYEESVMRYLNEIGKPAHARRLFQIAVEDGYQTSGNSDPYHIFCASLRANSRFVLTGKRMFNLAKDQQTIATGGDE